MRFKLDCQFDDRLSHARIATNTTAIIILKRQLVTFFTMKMPITMINNMKIYSAK